MNFNIKLQLGTESNTLTKIIVLLFFDVSVTVNS